MAKRRQLIIGGERIRRGETRDIHLQVSEMYTGEPVWLPIRVMRAAKSGPTVFLTAAIHGDEINGTGIIRDLLFGEPPALIAGTLICIPVVNIFAFESYVRYMPDGRDLNRCFPGSAKGSLASRFADLLMREIVSKCDYGFDLHSAAATRTNFPNVRADLTNPRVRELALAVGTELVVNGKGPEGSFRRAACAAGCPTIILEAGEVGKIEPSVVQVGLRAVTNLLIHLGMLEGEIRQPPYQARVNRTTWVRAELGGLLRFHVAPGEVIAGGQAIASNESVFGVARSIIISPVDGIVLGMTTHPAVKPGEPVCHIAIPERRVGRIREALAAASSGSQSQRVRDDLATSIVIGPADRSRPARKKLKTKKKKTKVKRTPRKRPGASSEPRDATARQGKTPRRS